MLETLSLVQVCGGQRYAPAAVGAIDRLRPVLASSKEGVMLRGPLVAVPAGPPHHPCPAGAVVARGPRLVGFK